ncbi:helix-turn-helix transcriptional regulator [Defluviimonas sp. WL0050]|uniref:Helix-turn-helix transcriptional regulator n=1 Tax=Albidovulum litorale TaxID=2984134 RepID=A0ABT2ZIJ7_9RHOB|nr:helix-turn-helix transcriptional regulator [Defluviimonas sp. WL0050]MCV2870880.1 helix-turn-helix transcriptional regulator [Defluviimonas sp. WL0050]
MTSNFVQNGEFRAIAAGSFETGIIEAMAEWCDALHGGTSLEDAFAHLAIGFGAEAALLVRTNMTDFRPTRIAVWDRRSASTSSPLTSSFADGCFGRPLARPRPGSIWLASTHEDDAGETPDPALANWQDRRGLTEFAALVLTGGPPVRDHIELHFTNPVPGPVQAAFAAVMPTMARTWASRQVGLVARTALSNRAPRDTGQGKGPVGGSVLGITNPARLSRAEFRVCLLLSRGRSVLGVAEELAVSESTIRSHLRSIYAKTNTSNLAELVFRLLATTQDDDLSDRNCA